MLSITSEMHGIVNIQRDPTMLKLQELRRIVFALAEISKF
jgi:hypothetical protein